MLHDAHIWTWHEWRRHLCEVRLMLVWRAQGKREAVFQHFADIERSRGKAAAERLKRDAIAQWAKGNRGAAREWL